ncbi:MAG: PTS sugar transporter subunit IIA [Streptococcaceae bacterium]|jgi:transcriptional antiterminator/mannitol/fructose-specific phosphotransferase system IIA component (Ntr-type)|nr:PTS sugar transporter subunit IIA [Streptococcaceae bacterium]
MTEKMKRANLFLQLLLEQSDYLSASYFAEKLGISKKTVYLYAEKLSDNLNERNLRISKVPRRGLLLVGKSKNKEALKIYLHQEVKRSNPNYSPVFRRLYFFSKILFEDNFKSYQNYADSFYVSVQSIKKDFDCILVFLRRSHVEVKRNRHFLILENEESEIQQVFKNYLEIYQEKNSLIQAQKDELFGKDLIQIVEEFLKEITAQSPYQPNDYLLNSLSNSLLIAVNRIKVGHHFSEKESLLFNRLEVMQFYMVVLRFVHTVNTQAAVYFSNSDIYYLCSLLFAHALKPARKEVENSSEIRVEVKEFIAEMSMLINYDLTQDLYLYQSLLSHIVPMIHRLQVGVLVKNPLRDKIIEQYATMYTLVGYGVRKLACHLSLSLNRDELTFITIHFQLAFEKVETVRHLLVICPTGLGTSQLVLQKIKQALPMNDVLESIDFKMIEQVELSKVDLIISTVELTRLSLPKRIPIVYVSPLPTVDEISSINQKLQNIESNEKSLAFTSHENGNVIDEILDKELIFIHNNNQTMPQVIDFLAEQFEKKKIVTKDFKAAIYRREEMGTTGISTGIAIPHADPATVLKTRLGIVTMAEPILWGEVEVSLIILVAISEKDTQKAKDIIASIYGLLTLSHRVNEIGSCLSREEVIKRMTSLSEYSSEYRKEVEI